MTIRFGFRSLNFNKVHLEVATTNQPALALYEKLGFSREGILRQHYFIEGEYLDLYVMSLLRSQFELAP